MRGVRYPIVLGLTVLVALFAWHPRAAAADAKKDIEVKIKEAMNAYDSFEYEEARKILNTALTMAKRSKLDGTALVARVHLNLGVVYFAGLKDEASARLSFLSAVEIEPKIQIDPAYRSAEMAKLLDEARSEASGGGGNGHGSGAGAASVDCKTVTGLQHTIVETAVRGNKRDLDALLGSDVSAKKVVIKYRPKGQENFSEVPMTKKDGCKYVGAIPAKGMNGELLHYYVAAIGADGREVASKGTEGSPNIIEIAMNDGSGRDDDNPLNPKKDDGEKKISGGVVAGGKKSTVFLGIAVGSGVGYVSGETEQEANKVECCFAPGLLHFAPELGYFVSRQLAISLVGRIGVPIGANIEGHATVAPAGLLRVRYAFSPRGTGIHVQGGVGGGIIRNTIKLSEAPDGMDTDIVAMGPLLVGAGGGYSAALSRIIRFEAQLNAIAGIPVVKTIGESHLNFGVQFDLSLGLSFGF